MFLKICTQRPKPHSLIFALIGHWEMPNGHSQQMFIQMIFDTAWEWNCAKRLQIQIGQRSCQFRKQRISAVPKVSVQGGSYAYKPPPIHRSSQSGLFLLSPGPALLELQTQLRSQSESLLLWATLGVCQSAFGCWLGSRHVGHKSRQSFHCSSSWVWEPSVL